MALASGVGKLLEFLGRCRPAVGDPHVALLVDEHSVGPEQQSFAEALHHFAVGVELHDRVYVGTGAGVGATAIACPDALAVDVDIDRADRAPLAAVGQNAPVAHGFIGVGKVVDGLHLRLIRGRGVTARRTLRESDRRKSHRGHAGKGDSGTRALDWCCDHSKQLYPNRQRRVWDSPPTLRGSLTKPMVHEA